MYKNTKITKSNFALVGLGKKIIINKKLYESKLKKGAIFIDPEVRS